MNATRAAARRRLIPLLLVALLAGCATPTIDWSARVGTYTFDQAVLDLGPPDKQAKLADGAVVAEWLTRRGYGYSTPAYPYWYGGPFYPTYFTDSSPDYYLRLVFAPDGRLKDWKKFAK
jgi:hypothetical protein